MRRTANKEGELYEISQTNNIKIAVIKEPKRK
jgi:hypothetical protein